MSDREQAIKDVAKAFQLPDELALCFWPQGVQWAVFQRERVIQLERDNRAKSERVIELERALREIMDMPHGETICCDTPLICGRDVPNDCIGCSWEDAASNLPAVAQTELPPIDIIGVDRTAAVLMLYPCDNDMQNAKLVSEYAARFCRERQLHESIAQVASLAQRLQEKDAALEDVIRRKNHYNEAYCEIDDQLTALQVSHDALLDAGHEAFVVMAGEEGSNNPFDAERWSKAVSWLAASLINAEKLRGHTASETKEK